MYPLLPLGAGILVAYYFLTTFWKWKKNIDAAKASGLPYFVVPVSVFSLLWLFVNRPVLWVLKKISKEHRPLWAGRVSSMHTWDNLFSNFDGNKLDTYLTVAPGRCMLYTANAEVIVQMTTRRNDFPKPGRMYRSINIFGRNLVTAEGQLWRRHRKVTGPSFSERNNHLVWSESIRQASSMIRSWTGKDGNDSRSIKTIQSDAMRLTLHVISRAGFGVRLLWPGVETSGNSEKKGATGEMDASNLGEGHTMTYTEALETLLHSLLFVVAVPMGLLKILPFKKTRLARESFLEWGKYMSEMMQTKKIELASGTADEGGMDLMGALVKSAGYGASPSLSPGTDDTLSDDEILGNAFVFILAGHETTANTIHFSLVHLAMHPSSQRRLQADLDSIFGSRGPEDWDYDADLPRLFGGMAGAVLNETLRLIPPAIHVPKETTAAQPIAIDGKEYTVPADTLILLSAVGAHRNPRYWPVGPPAAPARRVHETSNVDNDLEEFKPERWLLGPEQKGANAGAGDGTLAPAAEGMSASAETEALGVNTAADTAASLFKPERGAYIPFSEGYRSCIGRRFAQVEVLVVLALVLSRWSVELAVDEWAGEEEVSGMRGEERRGVWEKAWRGANAKMREKMGTVVTIQLRGGEYIPLRIVRRGGERFDYDV